MRGLHVQCLALQKDVVILGGDAHLRAVAVAAGFPAATSLMEWEATQPRLAAVVPPPHNPEDDWERPLLTLVPFEDERDIPTDPFDPFNEVPPEFVLELMARDGEYGAPDASDEHEAAHASATPAEDDLLAAHERYEEHITRAIRHTGGLSLSWPTHPPIAPFSAISSDPPEGADGDSSPSL